MRRSGPPNRKTGLRRTPFRRTPSARRRTSNRSKIPAKIRSAVEARAKGLCEIRANGHCEDRGYHCHHRLPRSAGGQHTVENLALCCSTCHRWIHAHPACSYENGWLLRRTP